MKKYLFWLLLLAVLAAVQAQAQEHSLYGNSSVYGLGGIPNDSYLAAVPEASEDQPAQLLFGLRQDLSASFAVGPLTSVNMDLLFTASLLNSVNNGLTLVAPVQLEVNQLYLQLPLGDMLMLYAGKRVKEMGMATHFPLVNRINPRLFTHTSVSGQGAGLVELNCFPLPWLNVAGALFFKDMDMRTAKWDELSLLGQVDLQFYPVDVSLFVYAEGFDNIPLGLASAVQLGYFTVYGEYLYTKQGVEKVLSDADELDPLKAFTLRDKDDYHAVSAGLRFRASGIGLALEYAWNNDLYSAAEASILQDYVSTYAAAMPVFENREKVQAGIIGLYRQRYRFLPHNAVVSASWSPNFLNSLTVAGKAAFSFPGTSEDISSMWGYAAQASLSYILPSSVQASLSYDWFGGGVDSEYVLYETLSGRFMLVLGMGY